MKSTIYSLLAFTAFFSASAFGANKPLACKKTDGNVCYRIAGVERSRIDGSAVFQKALRSVGDKMQGLATVYIVQGYRTAAQQAALVNAHCKGRSSCAGYASPKGSRHVISIAADPMLYGNQLKAICYAENQARTELLGPRSAAAVYGYDKKTNLTWAHIDDSTGSNYTPKNCGRNEGLNGEKAVASSGAPESQRVKDYKAEQKQAPAARDPASVANGGGSSAATKDSCGYYAILDCAKSYAGAKDAADYLGGGLNVIQTSNVPSFAPGWYCVTPGFSTRDSADATVKKYKSKAAGYVKKGC